MQWLVYVLYRNTFNYFSFQDYYAVDSNINYSMIIIPENFENNISSYELEVMTRTWTNIFGKVFGPCAIVALEHKRPKKHKP